MKLPPPLSWLWAGWMKFSHAFGRVMSAIILTVLWIVGFGLYGIILKIMRLFQSKTSPTTYWIDIATETPESMKRQF